MRLLVDSVEKLPPSASKRDIEASTSAARWAGFQVLHIEPDFVRCENAAGALWMLPGVAPERTFWLGYIPSAGRYREIYEAARAKGAVLPNSPTEHNRAMELDIAAELLGSLTPKTAVARNVDEALEKTKDWPFPIFVKGAVQSLKAEGWSSCVAESKQQLRALASRLLRSGSRARGKILMRELLHLRHARVSGLGVPMGREYRVFVYGGTIVSRFYYWDCDDELGTLSDDEAAKVEQLALEAAAKLGVPFLAVDVGQDVGGRWWVIETADGQFAGISSRSVVAHWSRLKTLADEMGVPGA